MWLIGGDFNEIMSSSNKKGGRPINTARSGDMWDMVHYCELIDLGFNGNRFTWLNKRYKNKYSLIYERSNRFLANEKWVHKFPNSQVIHLPRTHSDHCPLLLSLHNNNLKVDKLFKFKTM